MVFINRRTELDHLERLCSAVVGGTTQRHLAFVGVRRIGKSLLLAHYIESNPPALRIPFQVDEASTSFPMFLMTMLRAAVGVAAHRAGLPSLLGLPQTRCNVGRVPGQRFRRRKLSIDRVGRALQLRGIGQ